MGFYFNGNQPNKLQALVTVYGGTVVNQVTAYKELQDPEKGVIVVLERGTFQAAGLAFDKKTFSEYVHAGCPKHFVVLERQTAYNLCRYKQGYT